MTNPTLALAAAALAAACAGAALAQPTSLAAPAPVAAPADAPKPAASPTTKTAEQAAADRENEMVCKRELEIASLVKTRKTCHTRAQWAYIQSENKRNSQDFIAANTNRPSSN